MSSDDTKQGGDSALDSSDDKTFEIAGKKVKVGQRMSVEEAEEFMRAILESSPGPVTFKNTDQSTGTTTTAVVDEWKTFTDGPKTNKSALDENLSEFSQKGYLSLYDRQTGGLKEDNKFVTLAPSYFTDFDEFKRCQDIPPKYLKPLRSSMTRATWFVSHRWMSLDHPDPSGQSFSLIREFTRRHQVEGIWYDYACMPQEPLSNSELVLFRESLRDLNALITSVNFLAITTDDYESRAWCYYEMMIAELLCGSKKATIAPKDYKSSLDELLPMLAVKGKIPRLSITKEEDREHVQELLITGVKLFRSASVAVTLDILNGFGFKFGVGAASRYTEFIVFDRLWMIWQMLAGSSEHSGITLRHLLDPERLRNVLLHRHERFGTHARLFREIPSLAEVPLDLRIVEQDSHERLQKLVVDTVKGGSSKANFTNLALIKLVYALAGQ